MAKLNFTAASIISDAQIDEWSKKAPVYNEGSNRFDPFDKDYLEGLILNCEDSTLLNRKIISVDDAFEHALLLCKQWADRDAILEENNKNVEAFKARQAKKKEVTEQRRKENSEELEKARLAWKAAMDARDASAEFHAKQVKEAHLIYSELRKK